LWICFPVAKAEMGLLKDMFWVQEAPTTTLYVGLSVP
jgi:hypothetical protein